MGGACLRRGRAGGRLAWWVELRAQGWRYGGREGSLGGGKRGRYGLGVEAQVGGPWWGQKGVSNAHGQRENIGQREERLVRRRPERRRRRRSNGRGGAVGGEGGGVGGVGGVILRRRSRVWVEVMRRE